MRTIPFTDTDSLPIPRIIPFLGLMMLILITTFALSLQLTQQSAISQEVKLNQTAHAIVYHGGELMNAQWQLFALANGKAGQVADTQDITTQRIVIEQHLQRLVLPPELATQPAVAPIAVALQEYRRQWTALQPMLEQLMRQPQEPVAQQQVQNQIVRMNQQLRELVYGGQQLFTARFDQWLESLKQFNALLTSAASVLLITVLLVSYLFYLFFKVQSHVEEALRNSANRLHAILDTIPDAVLRLKRGGWIVDYKPAKQYQPFLPEDCMGQSLGQIVPQPAASLLQQTIEQVFLSGEQQTIEYQLAVVELETESRMKAEASDMERTFEARFLPTANDEIQLLVRDITAEKAADAATLQAQKLESIGILAGGIAHDFNNILTGLLAQTTLARRKIEKGLPVLSNLNKAILSANRAADLTRQLLAYAGQGKFEIRPLNLNSIIHDTMALLETALPSRTQLRFDLAESLPAIEADQGQIQQVVMNLVINAAEALQPENGKGQKGEVWVRTASYTLGEAAPFANYMAEPLTPGQYVLLEVCDNGVGMDQATVTRIFDPFFSTKATGHGLGLSATLGIIRTHRGGIHVESRLGQGTTFTVLLPAFTAGTVAPSASTTIADALVDLSRTILVIDDEAPVRDAVSDILIDQGFAVMTAAGGEEGLTTLRHQREKIGLVLLDVRMPGLSGPETYQQLRRLDPALKVVFTSGYSESEMAIDLQNTEGVTFLAKPYSAERLTEHVHQVMRD